MSQTKPTYQELEQRCQAAESALTAIRSGQADMVIGENGVLVLRLKEAEKAFQEAELKYRSLAENSPDIIYIIDLKKNKSGYLNRETLLGYSLEELEKPGESLLSKVHPDDLSAVKMHWQEALAGSTTTELEYRLQLKDGSWEWLHSRPRVLSWSAEGKPVQLLVTLSIITERKQAERRLRSMLDIAQAMSQFLDTKTILQQIVDNITQVAGLDSGAIYTLADDQLYLEATTPALPPEFPEQFRLANLADHPHIRAALAERSPVIISDTGNAELTEAEREVSVSRGLRSIAYLPLMSARKVIGVLIVASAHGLRTFSEEELNLYKGFSGQAAQIIENAQLYDSIRVHSNELEQQITERKQAEEKLRESEKLYRHAMEVAGAVPYYELYNENPPAVKYEFIGEGIRQITGYGPEEFNAMVWDSLVEKAVPVEELEGFSLDEAVQRTRNGEFPIWKCEFRLHDRDGKVHWVFEAAVELRDENGNPVGSIGSYQDITIRKQAEEKLRKSEEQYRGLMGTLDSVVATIDDSGKFLYMNEVAASQLGGAPHQLIGRSLHELFPEPLAFQYLQGVHNVMQTNKSMVNETLTIVDGGARWFRNSLQPIHDENGNVIQVLLHAVDIHELKTIQQELADLNKSLERRVEERTVEVRQANQALERALLAKDEFLASMSHELRTPLTGILGFSEAMQMNVYGILNERQQKIVGSINSSGKHLLDLINDILDLSKTEAGKLEIQKSPTLLADICLASLQLTKGMSHKKGQYVNTVIPEEPIILDLDMLRIKQVLVNLLSNAIKFTPENGELGLTVETDEANRLVRVIVWDKGIGIKPENFPKLFQPFTQIDGSLAREYVGTGLGLSLVRRLVELHDGSVTVESVFGEGSRFIVTLPWITKISPSVSEHTESAWQASPKSVPANLRPLGKVLIVDDNPSLLEMLTDYLEGKNFSAASVRSGIELLEKIEAIKPDVILMDIQMPGMDGLEAIRRIRAFEDRSIASIPIIAVTALAMRGDRELFMAAGANGYVSKPIKLNELVETIQSQLGGSKQ